MFTNGETEVGETMFCNLVLRLQVGICCTREPLPVLAMSETYSATTDEKQHEGDKSQPKTCSTNAKEKSE